MSVYIRLRSRITKKKHIFFLPSARIRLLPISEKNQLISGDKKKDFEKTSLFQEIKKHFPSYVFIFLVFFSSPSLTFFTMDQFFFYFVALINFSKKFSNVIFIWAPSGTFSKIGSTFFFLKCFFYRPPS